MWKMKYMTVFFVLIYSKINGPCEGWTGPVGGGPIHILSTNEKLPLKLLTKLEVALPLGKVGLFNGN